MRKLTINIDMDGVIYAMMGQLARIAEQPEMRAYMESMGYELPEGLQSRVDRWEIWLAWNIDKKAFWKMFYQSIDLGVFRNGDPIDGAVEVIGRFVRKGHRVRIVTSKQFSTPSIALKAQTDTLEWLYERTPWAQKVEIAFAHNKQGYVADVIIDDKPTLSWAQEGAVNVLFDQPWNQNVKAAPCGSYPVPANVYRTDKWQHAEYLVDKVANSD